VHTNIELAPGSSKARALAARWDDIRERARPLFQGQEKLWHSLGRAHLDGQYDQIPEAAHAGTMLSCVECPAAWPEVPVVFQRLSSVGAKMGAITTDASRFRRPTAN
jgi:hypothetical protein